MPNIHPASREAQNDFPLRSHERAAPGFEDGRITSEIARVSPPPSFNPPIASDNGIRTDTSLEQLRALKPVFDRRYGTVTAGNSSPLTDRGGAVLLLSDERAKGLGDRPLAYIRS